MVSALLTGTDHSIVAQHVGLNLCAFHGPKEHQAPLRLPSSVACSDCCLKTLDLTPRMKNLYYSRITCKLKQLLSRSSQDSFCPRPVHSIPSNLIHEIDKAH